MEGGVSPPGWEKVPDVRYVAGPGGTARIEGGRVEHVFGWRERIQHRLFRVLAWLLPAGRQRVEDALYHVQEALEGAQFLPGGDAHEATFGETYSAEEANRDLIESLRRAHQCLLEVHDA